MSRAFASLGSSSARQPKVKHSTYKLQPYKVPVKSSWQNWAPYLFKQSTRHSGFQPSHSPGYGRTETSGPSLAEQRRRGPRSGLIPAASFTHRNRQLERQFREKKRKEKLLRKLSGSTTFQHGASFWTFDDLDKIIFRLVEKMRS